MKNRSRVLFLVLALMMISTSVLASVPTKQEFREPRVFILNQEVDAEVKPFIQNGTTMVPVRAIIETIGGDVRWDPQKRQVLLILKGRIIDMTIDDTTVKVNGQPRKMGNAPTIKDGVTMIPARAIAEALGYEIFFREHTGNVYIQSDMFRLRSIYGPNI